MSFPANTGMDRRTVVKGAAWSVPVLAAAAATPLAAATVTWNAELTGGCFAGLGGVGLVPSFRVKETLGQNTTLPQVITETYFREFRGAALASELAAQRRGELIVAGVLVEWNLFRVNTLLQGKNSSKIELDDWPTFDEDDITIHIEESGDSPTLYTPTVRFVARRNVTVTGLLASEEVAWGYAASVLAGGAVIEVAGVQVAVGEPAQLSAMMISGTGVTTGDETASLVGLLGC